MHRRAIPLTNFVSERDWGEHTAGIREAARSLGIAVLLVAAAALLVATIVAVRALMFWPAS